jgi:hypothetical protein
VDDNERPRLQSIEGGLPPKFSKCPNCGSAMPKDAVTIRVRAGDETAYFCEVCYLHGMRRYGEQD